MASFDDVGDMTGYGPAGDDDRRACCDDLRQARAAGNLRCSFAGASWQRRPLMDPRQGPCEPAKMTEMHCGRWSEGRSSALLPVAIHFVAQLPINLATRRTRCYVCSRGYTLSRIRAPDRGCLDRRVAIAAHSTGGCNRRYAIELRASRTRSCANLAMSKPEQARRWQWADVVAGHDRDDFALAIVQLGEPIGGAPHTIQRFNLLGRSNVRTGALDASVHLDPLAPSQPRQMASFVVAPSPEIYGHPEHASDAARREWRGLRHDRCYRVAQDFFLSRGRDALHARLATQLGYQGLTAPMKLMGRFLGDHPVDGCQGCRIMRPRLGLRRPVGPSRNVDCSSSMTLSRTRRLPHN